MTNKKKQKHILGHSPTNLSAAHFHLERLREVVDANLNYVRGDGVAYDLTGLEKHAMAALFELTFALGRHHMLCEKTSAKRRRSK